MIEWEVSGAVGRPAGRGDVPDIWDDDLIWPQEDLPPMDDDGNILPDDDTMNGDLTGEGAADDVDYPRVPTTTGRIG